jgi:hypothetical protein
MRVEGRWLDFEDGELRPVIDAEVLTTSGSWKSVIFLLDAGSDVTVFDTTCLRLPDLLCHSISR